MPVDRPLRLSDARELRPADQALPILQGPARLRSPSPCSCRLFLFGFTALVIWLSLLTGIPDREDSADFYCLLLGADARHVADGVGQSSADDLHGVEMASLPSYALAGFLKGRRQSSEAALKYVVYGGGASGVMLYGISLLAGKFGTGYLPDLAVGFVGAMHPPGAATVVFDPVLVLGALFILIGIAFKLAAVPFHFWCPDVFEGASAEVAGFLSVASKGAALALLARLTLTLAGIDPLVMRAACRSTGTAWSRYLVPTLAFFAALTATFGNLAAYLQTNLKRLLAYSTIAHAGYMMMGLAPLTAEGTSAVLFYLVAYLFMNLGAFAVVAFLRNPTGSEDLTAYRGLVPALAVDGGHAVDLPAEPARHSAAGRLRGQVPDLRRAVSRGRDLLRRTATRARASRCTCCWASGLQHGAERGVLHQGDAGDDPRQPGRGRGGPGGGTAAGAGRVGVLRHGAVAGSLGAGDRGRSADGGQPARRPALRSRPDARPRRRNGDRSANGGPAACTCSTGSPVDPDVRRPGLPLDHREAARQPGRGQTHHRGRSRRHRRRCSST